MFRLNWKYYLIIILIIAVIIMGVIIKINLDDSTEQKLDFLKEKKELKKVERDNYIKELEDVTEDYNKKIDSILEENSKIKYSPYVYEKIIYVNRSLDTALNRLPRARQRFLQQKNK